MRVTLPRGEKPRNIREYSREEFLTDVWQYRPGEHATFIGPTEAGKTTLAYQLLAVTATPKLPALTLVMKPRDRTVSQYNRELGFRRVRRWPPTPSPWYPRRPPGYALWPRHTYRVRDDNIMMSDLFGDALIYCYKRGNWIVFADELAGLQAELGLTDEVNALYSRGRSMGTGIWGATQRPFLITQMAYGNSHHLFLAHDPDQRNRDRFGEIGSGINPKLIDRAVEKLPMYRWLYIRRRDRRICIIHE